MPAKWRPILHRDTVIVENWHRFAPESPHKDGDKTYAVVDKGEETPTDFLRRILGSAADRLPILVLNDEGHHCWRPVPGTATGSGLSGDDKTQFDDEAHEAHEATVWVDGLDRLNAAGGEAPAAKRGKKPKPRIAYGPGEVFPELFSNTADRKVTIRIDSKLLAQAEAGGSGVAKKKADAAEELRCVVATVGKAGEPGEHVRCVVSVAMLTEGWDANTVTQILGLRAFTSQLLCEQVVGRGLRRMAYKPDPVTGLLTEEYCDVYGVPFSVIPFRDRSVNKPEPDDTPPNLVRALPERVAREMRFPVVEGYAFALRRNLIRCDIDAMEPLRIEPNREPTGTFVRPQVGVQVGGGMSETQSPFGFNQQDRKAYYESVHLQTTLFQAAQRIVEELTQAGTAGSDGRKRRVFALQSRHALFPQVFRVVEEYVRRKVNFNGAPEPELGLETYARQVVERVRDAIQPDDSLGEPPLLPLLNRT